MLAIFKLRFVFSLLLICCLFLPLSQCTTHDANGVLVIKTAYVFKVPQDIESWVGALAFSAPLLLLLTIGRSQSKIHLLAILSLPFSGVALYIASTLTFWSEKVLIGGYFALASSASLVALSFIEIGFTIAAASKAASKQDHS